MMKFPGTPEALSLHWLNQLHHLPGRPFAALTLAPLGEDTGFYGRLVKVEATPTE